MSMHKEFHRQIAEQFEESIRVKQQMLETNIDMINEILQVMLRALQDGHKILLFGNGGSAADAQHIAAEFVNRFRQDRRALPAVSLSTDTSILTSIANDYNFDLVFSRQIEALGQEGDVAMGISTSGNSANIIKAMQVAKRMGLRTIGFTGEDGGLLKSHVEICLQVPSRSTPRIQEVHITAAHALCDLIEKELCRNEG